MFLSEFKILSYNVKKQSQLSEDIGQLKILDDMIWKWNGDNMSPFEKLMKLDK